MVYKYLGYGVTDSNGVAKLDHDAEGQELQHSYTGVGAGEVDVVASLDNPVSSGSIVSGTFNVWDTMIYYNGDNSVWNIQNNNIDITPLENGGRFVHSTGTSSDYVILQKGNTRWWIDYDKDWCIEFDYSRTNTSSIHFGTLANQGLADGSFNLPYDGTEIFVKFEYKHSENKIYRIVPSNPSLNTSYDFNPNNSGIGFFFADWQHDMNITIRNLKMYYI